MGLVNSLTTPSANLISAIAIKLQAISYEPSKQSHSGNSDQTEFHNVFVRNDREGLNQAEQD